MSFVIFADTFIRLFKVIDCFFNCGPFSRTTIVQAGFLHISRVSKLCAAIGAFDDSQVIHWIKTHLIKEQSNSLDDIITFLDESKVSYRYEINGITV